MNNGRIEAADQRHPAPLQVAAPVRQRQGPTLCQKICDVALMVFLAAAAAVLFIINPGFFLVGALIGIVYANESNAAIQKIIGVWKSQRIIGTLIIGTMAFLALPTTLVVASCLGGLKLGSYAYQQYRPEQNRGLALQL